MQKLLIRGGHALTMDPGLGDLPEGDVLVEDGVIVEVAPRLPGRGARVIEAGGRIVIPGFVDGHRHAWQSVLHGLAGDWSFPQYMRRVRGGYGGCFDAEDAYTANLLGGLESLSAGITTIVDHSHLQTSDDIGKALLRGLWDSGVGGYFAYAFQNSPDWLGAGYSSPEDLNDLLVRIPDEGHDKRFLSVRSTLENLDSGGTGRLKLGAALPETTPYLPLDVARAVVERVRAQCPALLTGHWNAFEHEGRHISLLDPLVDAGLFDGVTVLSHCNQCDDHDLDTMVRAGIGLVTTPGTEAGMGLGPMQAHRLVSRGGTAAIGVDTTCYTAADVMGQSRSLLEAERRDAAASGIPRELAWSARGALELATSTGARAVGLGDEVGSLTPGKRADITVVRPDAVRSTPTVDAVAALVFYTGPGDVETVLVAGEIRKRAGELVGVDTADLAQRSDRVLQAVRDRYATLPSHVVEGAWQGMF